MIVHPRRPILLKERDEVCINSLTFSPEGRLLIAGTDDEEVSFWDVEKARQLAVLDGGRSYIMDISYHPSGSKIAAVSDNGQVEHWNLDPPSLIRRERIHSKSAQAVCFLDKGRICCTGGRDKKLILTDFASGKTLETIEIGLDISGLETIPGTKKVVVALEEEPVIQLWDFQIGRHCEWECTVGEFGCHALSVNSTGKIVAVGGADFNISLVDVATGEVIGTLEGHASDVKDVAFGPDDLLISGSWNDDVRLWNVNTRTCLWTSEVHGCSVQSVAFSPAGNYLASGDDKGRLLLWPLTADDGSAFESGRIARVRA